jgi:hypothetical protein
LKTLNLIVTSLTVISVDATLNTSVLARKENRVSATMAVNTSRNWSGKVCRGTTSYANAAALILYPLDSQQVYQLGHITQGLDVHRIGVAVSNILTDSSGYSTASVTALKLMVQTACLLVK